MIRSTVTTVALLVLSSTASAETVPTPRPSTADDQSWLAKSFVKRLLIETDATKREALAEQILSPDYMRRNPFVPPGRAGLIAYKIWPPRSQTPAPSSRTWSRRLGSRSRREIS
ncbi:hypothetical protein ACLB0R_04625 [Sphingomonas sp. GlSt437]|uniref:hypothetical protein n=1 Tax=Sphingomonas sp. GlSt437 TaxID=3389970 RepID=UPI003A84B598